VPDKITAMDEAVLIALAADLESDRVERTVSSNDGDKFREAVCAFANDMPNHRLPGVLFVGLRDDGTCGNVPITDQLLQNLASIRSDGNVVPFPSLVVQKRTLNGCEMAVVIVQPSYDPPVRFKGRVSIRVGPRRATASPEEERRLIEKRRSRDVPFDLFPVRTSTLDDLDLELFAKQYLPSAVAIEVIEKNNRSIEQQLLSLRFLSMDRESHERFPTMTGLIVIGREPRNHVPGAYIQFIRFAGTLLTDPIKDNKEITGPLSEMIQRLDEVFRAHIGIQTEFKSGTVETRRPDYPLVALQQIARNAIMHRNYEGTNSPTRINWFDDRIEVLSPGGPFGQVSIENFGTGVTDYRNSHIAEAMKALGYVQRFGVGIATANAEMSRNGNPNVVFDVQANNILAVLKRQ
jgi:ATP-dependent DNA helicase RecG